MKIPTTSREDYLKAIYVLQKQSGFVRSVDLSHYLGVSKPSVSRAVSLLIEGGFLLMDRKFYLLLTESGMEIAKRTYERHRFFTNRLISIGVSPAIAEEDACKLEHAISEESFTKLKEAFEKEGGTLLTK